MQFNVIVTRDIVANVYSNPMFVPHIGMAIRSFGDECRRKEQGNPLGAHPEDYELWHVGTYEDTTCEWTIWPHAERKQLAVGANYRD